MELESLQEQWKRLDEKLERTLKLESELLRLAVTRPARRRIHRLAIWPAIDVALCVGALQFVGFFIVRHWNTWSLVAPASVLVSAAVLLLVDSILELERISKINWDGPVADIQSSLARLRIVKIRQFKWVMLLSPLVGFCGLVVGVQWLLDRLPEQHFILDKLNPWAVAVNYAFGVLFILFGHMVVRFLARQFGNRSWWQSALDGISGTSMNKARADVERWRNLSCEALNDTD
jgi:hypothetical protein